MPSPAVGRRRRVSIRHCAAQQEHAAGEYTYCDHPQNLQNWVLRVLKVSGSEMFCDFPILARPSTRSCQAPRWEDDDGFRYDTAQPSKSMPLGNTHTAITLKTFKTGF